MTNPAQRSRIRRSGRKMISDVGRVKILESGAATFEIMVADGSVVEFECSSKTLMKLISRLTSHSLFHSAGELERRFQPDIRIAYEPGMARVKLSVGQSASDTGFHLILSNQAAEEIGRDLLTAAEMSLSSPGRDA